MAKKKKKKDEIQVMCPACGHKFTASKEKDAMVAEFKCKKCTARFTLSWPLEESDLERRFRLGEEDYL